MHVPTFFGVGTERDFEDLMGLSGTFEEVMVNLLAHVPTFSGVGTERYFEDLMSLSGTFEEVNHHDLAVPAQASFGALSLLPIVSRAVVCHMPQKTFQFQMKGCPN